MSVFGVNLSLFPALQDLQSLLEICNISIKLGSLSSDGSILASDNIEFLVVEAHD